MGVRIKDPDLVEPCARPNQRYPCEPRHGGTEKQKDADCREAMWAASRRRLRHGSGVILHLLTITRLPINLNCHFLVTSESHRPDCHE